MAASDVMNREVLFKHRELQTNLSNQIAAIKSGDHDIDRILNQLEAIQTNATSIGDFLSCIVPCKFYNEHRAGTSTIAEKALHIPELLEMILEHCDILDVARMLQTCNGATSTTSSTTMTEREESSLRIPMSGAKTWFKIGHEFFNGLLIQVDFIPDSTHERCPKVGELWKRMLICQPPIMELKLYKSCERCKYRGFSGVTYDIFSTGRPLTFGDLYDKVIEKANKRGECWNRNCGYQGPEWVWVQLQCKVPLPRDRGMEDL